MESKAIKIIGKLQTIINEQEDEHDARIADRDAIIAERDDEIYRLEDELEALKFNACSKCKANMTDMG